jgi:hypothetical protein
VDTVAAIAVIAAQVSNSPYPERPIIGFHCADPAAVRIALPQCSSTAGDLE